MEGNSAGGVVTGEAQLAWCFLLLGHACNGIFLYSIEHEQKGMPKVRRRACQRSREGHAKGGAFARAWVKRCASVGDGLASRSTPIYDCYPVANPASFVPAQNRTDQLACLLHALLHQARDTRHARNARTPQPRAHMHTLHTTRALSSSQ